MAVLTLNGGSVSISSSWYYRYDPDERDYLYGTPSIGYDAVYFDLSDIPVGAEIQSAVLTASRWGSGRLLMAGVNAGTVEIDPADINPEEELRITFSFQASGGYKTGSATSGTMTASGGFQNITLTITYEMPYTAPTAPTAVTLSKAMATPGESVTLSWSGAKAGNNVNISGYQVYRASSADGEYAYLAETAADTLNLSVTAPGSAGSYFYKVKALGDISGYDSGLSDAYAQVSVSVTAPAAPDTLTIIPSAQYPGGEATLSFSGAAAGENNPIRGYALWQSSQKDSGYTKAETLTSTAASGSFTVTAPQSGSLYFKVQTLGQYMDGPLSEAAVITADLSGTSDFTLSSDTVDAGEALSITLLSNTDKAHTLIASIGEYSETIMTDAGAESISFTPPLSWLSAMPESETAPMLLSLETEGAGTIEKTALLRCPDDVGPMVSGAYALRIDNDVPADWGVYVQGKSQAEIHLDQEAEMAYGSPILLYRMAGAGATAESAGLPFTMMTGLLPAGEVTITLSATDARGRTGTQKLTIPVEPYQAPALKNIVTLRCDAQGNEMDEGAYASMEADLIYSSCGGHNSVSVTAAYRIAGTEEWINAGSMAEGMLIFGNGELNIGQNYDVRYLLGDGLGAEVIYYDVITRAKPELHIKRGGGAWAFGGLADVDGALKIYGNLLLSGSLMLGTENAGKLLYINDAGKAQPLSLGEGMYILDGVLNLGTPPWAGTPLSELAAGTLVYLLEEDYVPYLVLAHGHHGDGLTTLIRYRTSSTTSAFFKSAPSYSASNKYETSALCAAYASYYAALPGDTQGKIEEVAIPVLANTSTGAISARMFALSVAEYTGESPAEGTHIPYFTDNASRKAYAEDGATAQYVWTRTAVGGMADYARSVYSDGRIGNNGVENIRPLRPACCVKSDAILTKDNQGRYIL